MSLLENTLALLGSIVRATAGGVTELLGGGLLALCDVLVCGQVGKQGTEVLTRLDSAGDTVTGTGHTLADLVGGRLLGVRGDCRTYQRCSVNDNEAGVANSSQTPARRDPCGGCQT